MHILSTNSAIMRTKISPLSPTLLCCGKTLILDMQRPEDGIKMIEGILFNEKPDETKNF